MCKICIDSVFRGPPDSGNGGYVAGAFAKHLKGDVEVKLLQPPPLEKALHIHIDDDFASLLDGNQEIAQARQVEFPKMNIPKAPSLEEAKKASLSSPSYQLSEQIDCFVCSVKRKEGQGLRIFAGALGRDQMVAAPWYPYAALADESGLIKEEFIWAALDCPGAMSAYACVNAPFLLLGKQTSHIEHPLPVNQNYIACGWHEKKEGRKHFTHTALFNEAGDLLACATQVWIELKKD